MNREGKILGVASAAIAGLFIISYFSKSSDFSGLGVFIVFAGILGIIAVVLNRKKVEEIFNMQRKTGKDSSQYYSEEKIRESVKEWADRNYKGFNSADFSWSNAETGQTWIADFGENDRKIKYLRYYYTSLGPSGKDVIIFWNSSDDDGPVDHKRVRKNTLEDPFWFCDEYREWVRANRPMPRSSDEEDRGQRMQFVGVQPSGLNQQGQGGSNQE